MAVERRVLRPLPARRTAEYGEIPARVSKFGLFTVKTVQYSVPSQLIGHRLMVRLYESRIEDRLGGQCVLTMPRATYRNGQRHARQIDHRHLVSALKRKPGAFGRWVLRDAVFPQAVYRHTSERLAAELSEREACKTIVGLLCLAVDCQEAQLAAELEQLIELDELPDLHALSELLVPPRTTLPEVTVEMAALSSY